MSVTAIIPARFASSRFPGKPLVPILGRPLLQWVFDAANEAESIDRVLVATDDSRIEAAAQAFGAEVVRTSREARNGTERVAEVMEQLKGEYWLNIQGDEPLLVGADLDAVVAKLLEPGVRSATLAVPLAPEQVADPNTVKVVCDVFGDALYFSRSPIPYLRDKGQVVPRLHVGVYGFSRATLATYARLGPTGLEQTEGLEQLRLIENRIPMRVALRDTMQVGINAPEDCAAAIELLAARART